MISYQRFVVVLEQVSEIRYEYWQGEVFAMSGASPAHGQIPDSTGFCG
jgi:hypothetical protein